MVSPPQTTQHIPDSKQSVSINKFGLEPLNKTLTEILVMGHMPLNN
jgi:hypothetical protein